MPHILVHARKQGGCSGTWGEDNFKLSRILISSYEEHLHYILSVVQYGKGQTFPIEPETHSFLTRPCHQCVCTGLRSFVSRPVDIVPARTRDLAKQLGPNFEEIKNDTPGSQNE